MRKRSSSSRESAPAGQYARLQQQLDQLDVGGLRRNLQPLHMETPTTARIDGKPVTVFCSNDYLGLARTQEVMSAYRGAGAGSARLLAGDRPAHHALERALGERFGRPATVFTSGWHANLALYTTLLRAGDVVASDALVHASTIDGLRLSGATKTILPHGTVKLPPKCRLLAVEGLYSMDGDVPNLRAARAACDAAGAWLAVDEAHSVGTIGPDGRGVAAAQGVQADFIVGTLGKAYGVSGAFVIGPPVLRDLLVSAARTFVYTTGLPEPICNAGIAGLQMATDGRRRVLNDNVGRLRDGLAQIGLHSPGQHHIVPVVLGGRTMAVAEALLKRGYFVPGIRAPTVAAGQERLRITVSAAHRPAQITGLVDAIGGAIDQLTAP